METSSLHRILETFRGGPPLVVAFSGGVDSSLLLAAAAEVLDDVVAVTCVSPLVPAREMEQARAFCEAKGIRHDLVTVPVLEDGDIAANPPRRCYHCKRLHLSAILDHAEANSLGPVVHGDNVDDAEDHRPGHKAADELGVRAPLAEAGYTKDDVRAMARDMGLAVHDKPAAACLATRIPHGTLLTSEILSAVEKAEDLLHDTGFRHCRVRHHGTVARIEVPPEDIGKLASHPERIRLVEAFRELGFAHVSLDLLGYETGRMNLELRDTEAK
ncbi:MAG: ATP-dependent sacrificial sulfur transferase LarE [Desulfatibacillaceae bacterium]